MSKVKRIGQRNSRAAFVMGITAQEHAERLVAGELPYRLTPRRIAWMMKRYRDRQAKR